MPTLETSSEPSFRRPLTVDVLAELAFRSCVFDCSCEAASDAEPTINPAPVNAVFAKKSRRPVAFGCCPLDPVLFDTPISRLLALSS
jgi:hypothetical protein